MRIGFILGEEDNKGTILQSCLKMPEHHEKSKENGPFYGISYENGQYVWVSKEELIKLLN